MPIPKTQPYNYISYVGYSYNFDFQKNTHKHFKVLENEIKNLLNKMIEEDTSLCSDEIERYSNFLQRFPIPLRDQKLLTFKNDILEREKEIAWRHLSLIMARYRKNIEFCKPPTSTQQRKDIKRIKQLSLSYIKALQEININTLHLIFSSAERAMLDNPNYGDKENFHKYFRLISSSKIEGKDFLCFMKKIADLDINETENPIFRRDPFLLDMLVSLIYFWFKFTKKIPVQCGWDDKKLGGKKFGTFYDFQAWAHNIARYAIFDLKRSDYFPIISEIQIKNAITIFNDPKSDIWIKKNFHIDLFVEES